MRSIILLATLLLVAGVSADRSLQASATDPYGIILAAASMNEAAAASGFAKAGTAVDTNSVVAALVQIFDNVSGAKN